LVHRVVSAAPTGEAPRKRVWLRFQDQRDVELVAGVTIVGRGEGCQLILDDPLISRRHACFVVDERDVTLKDLGSTNGVLVNGSRVDDVQIVVPGDHITLGHQHAELCWVPASAAERPLRPPEARSNRPVADTVIDRRPSSAPPGSQRPADAELTRQGSVFDMLSGVAGKAFELGRGADAERILRRPLEALLVRLESGASVDPREADEAGLLAVRLARSTGQARWIDYVFRLFAGLGRLAPGAVIDELYPAVRVASGASLNEYRRYLDVLRNGSQRQFGPAERFLLRRLEGLEGVLVS
jgi:pSer/pThr/pTyr-binding forkhead associated (FHA) protein